MQSHFLGLFAVCRVLFFGGFCGVQSHILGCLRCRVIVFWLFAVCRVLFFGGFCGLHTKPHFLGDLR
jgi:hypothetical protein